MGTDKKDHILEVATLLFAEQGFEGTSIRDLAAKAGVNIAMINYYFGSKEKLFESLVEARATHTRVLLDEIVKKTGLSCCERFEQVIEVYIDRLFSNRSFHRVINQEMMLSQRSAVQQSIINILIPNGKIIKGLIEEGIRTKEFKPVDAMLTVSTLIGAINQVVLNSKYCIRMLNKEDNYNPYEDAAFKQRLTDHLKQLMRAHLLPS